VTDRRAARDFGTGNHDQFMVDRRLNRLSVSPIAIHVRYIGQVRLVFQVLGDCDRIETVPQSFTNSDPGPHVAI
tara:strand:- start:674 stop:895 length:222 start_codon:yes stop_codon:yes gene_type:complete